MKKVLFVASALTVSLLSGCAALDNNFGYKDGTQVTAAQVQQFQVGKSTQKDIIALLGNPQEMTQVGEDTHLIYNYTEVNHVHANKADSTRFIIAKSGMLKDVMQGAGQGKNPLTGGSL